MPWVNKFDWKTIQRYHEQGHSVRECAQAFGFTIGGWYKARARGLVTTISDSRHHRRYNWDEIQAYYDASNSWAKCMERFGFCRGAWQKARRRGAILSRPVTKPLEVLLRSGHRSSIKRRLLKDGILKNECSRCGISEWQDKPLSIQIDHINGINDDYRLENLRMLCPNCHSLTPTHGRRNVGRKKRPPLVSFLLWPQRARHEKKVRGGHRPVVYGMRG